MIKAWWPGYLQLSTVPQSEDFLGRAEGAQLCKVTDTEPDADGTGYVPWTADPW